MIKNNGKRSAMPLDPCAVGILDIDIASRDPEQGTKPTRISVQVDGLDQGNTIAQGECLTLSEFIGTTTKGDLDCGAASSGHRRPQPISHEADVRTAECHLNPKCHDSSRSALTPP